MSGIRLARVLARLLNLVVLTVSAWYLLLYLYRWEWNRAVISGVFFVAAEIALATSLLLDAIRSRRVEQPVAAAQSVITRENGTRPERHFDWLRAQSGRTGVFIPVLLGAGVILSGLAYIVERVAGSLFGPVVDVQASRAIPMDLPLGDGATVGRPGRPESATRTSRVGNAAAWVVATAVVVVLAVAAIDVLADATQSRPTPGPFTGSTTIVLEIEQRRLGHSPATIATALWTGCRTAAAPTARLERAETLDPRHAELVVTPELGELRRRRVFGCLQDATIDRVRADVVSWRADGTRETPDEG